MKYEETKYCEECARCKTISKNCIGQYEVKCWFGPTLPPDYAVYYCKRKKLKKEKKENVK